MDFQWGVADIILSSLSNFLFLFLWTNYLLVNVSTTTTARHLHVSQVPNWSPCPTLTTAFAHWRGFHRNPTKLSKSHHITLSPQTRQCLAVSFWGRDLDSGCQGAAQRLKNLPAVQETWVRILGRVGKIPLEKGMATHPLQYSCQENCMDRGAWQATVDGVTESQTQLSN